MKLVFLVLWLGLPVSGFAATPAYGLHDYARECERELGKIPVFRCWEGKEVPIFNSDTGTQVTAKNHLGYSQKCDKPTLLRMPREAWWTGINPCVPHARLGRSQPESGFETQWVWFCRRYFNRSHNSDKYDDINMIGHNPKTGATCFFVSTPNHTTPTSRRDLGHSGQTVPAVTSVRGLKFWKSPRTMETSPIPLGGGFRCTKCHDGDPFLHTPHIDQLTVDGTPEGEPLVPSNPNGKYYVVGSQYFSRPGWKTKHLVSPQAAACTACHRIGNQRGCREFTNLLAGTATMQHFSDAFRYAPSMPSDGERVEPRRTEAGSPPHRINQRYRDAVNFINQCCDRPTRPACRWEDLPR